MTMFKIHWPEGKSFNKIVLWRLLNDNFVFLVQYKEEAEGPLLGNSIRSFK